MVLDGRFELRAVVPGSGGAVLQAIDRESGASVLIRFFEVAPPMEVAAAEGVLKIQGGSGASILITEDTPAWRAWRPGAAPESSAAREVSTARTPAAEPGEFTRIFQAGAFSAPPAAPAAAVPAAAMPAAAMPGTAAPAAQPAGEFTRMFHPEAPAAPAPVPATPANPFASEPAGQTTDFDRFFQQPMAANHEPFADPAWQAPEMPSGKPFAGPSEFTKFFGNAPDAAAPSAPPPPAAMPGDSTSLFSQVPPAPAGTQLPGASEYTRFFEAESARTQTSASAPSAPAPQPAPLPPVRQAGAPGWVIAIIAGVTLIVCLWLVQKFIG